MYDPYSFPRFIIITELGIIKPLDVRRYSFGYIAHILNFKCDSKTPMLMGVVVQEEIRRMGYRVNYGDQL